MTIRENALAGNIVKVPLNGSPTIITEIPDGMMPHYSGAVIILAGDQSDGDINANIKTEFGVNVIGNCIAVSQSTWHNLTGE